MKNKYNLFSIIMISSIIFCSYGMATFSVKSKESFFLNLFLSIIIIGAIGLKLVISTYLSKKYLALIIISFIPLLITFRPNLISLFLIISLILLKNDLFNNKAKIVFLITSTISFFIIILLYFFFDFNKNYSNEIWNALNENYVYRESLGFTHPNQAMLKWLGIVLIGLSSITEKNFFIKNFFILMITLALFFITKSRTVFLATIFTILILFFFRNHLEKHIPLKIQKIVSVYPLVFLTITLLATYFPENSFLDLLFSGRFGFYKNAINTYGITILGTPSIEKGGGLIVDNSFLNTLISKGLLFFLIYCLIYYTTLKNNRLIYKNFILITTFFLCAFTETMLFKFDLVWVLFFLILDNNYKQKIRRDLK